MKSTAIACAIAAATLSFGSLAFAQAGNNPGMDDDSNIPHSERPGAPASQYGPYGRTIRNPQGQLANEYELRQRAEQNDQRWNNGNRDWRANNQARYYRGGYVPQEYRHSRYYVNDWRSRRLSAPPRGYQWVQTDNGDYLLMALATGIIASLVLNQAGR